MGHGSSKSLPEVEEASHLSRLKQKLHIHGHHHHRFRRIFRRSHGKGSVSGAYCLKLLTAEDFAGIALISLISVCVVCFFF